MRIYKKFTSNTPPPPVCVNNSCFSSGYNALLKYFYMHCHKAGTRSCGKDDSELGRSLTEMLGTLAVMGILTIGGIAGFNYAMDKSKANDILDGVNKRAIALSTYTMLGTNITSTTLNAEFSNHIGDSTVALAPEGAGFKLTVSGLTDSVCDKVLDNGLKMASRISLGETTIWEQGEKSDHDCAEADNAITFTFNGALDGSKTCGYCQHKENNTCVADATCDNGCPGDKPMGIGGNDCYSCSEYENEPIAHAVGATECAKCSNRFVDVWGECWHCNSPASEKTDTTECAKCPGRKMLDNGYCALKECANGQFRNNYGSCWSCGETYGFKANVSECAKCSQRESLDNGYCCLKDKTKLTQMACEQCGGTWDATKKKCS